MSVIVEQFQTIRFIQMMSLTFGLFTQVSGSGPLGPLVSFREANRRLFPFVKMADKHRGVSFRFNFNIRPLHMLFIKK